MSEWEYFKLSEFVCKCGCGQNLIDEDFVAKLDELRGRCGFPLRVTSGYRCPSHNTKVSTTGPNGPHTTGYAADFGVTGAQALELVGHATAMGFTGIGVNQKGAGRFIHVDMLVPGETSGPRPWIWSY